MKLSKFLVVPFICLSTTTLLSQTVYLTEGFENHLCIDCEPEGWSQEKVGTSPQLWRFRNGGHSPNDIPWAVPEGQEDITRNPPAAIEGTYNAIFFLESYNNERTKLITPGLDMLGATNPELSFYLCQIPWNFLGSNAHDFLRVYYRISQEDPWVLLEEYLDPVYEWELQTLTLPNPSETYYVAFEGQTRWGFGTCIDDINIQETGSTPMYIGDIEFEQLFNEHIPSGTPDLPVMMVDFKVFGNTDSVVLESIDFTSLNDSDGDILPSGVKLYSTSIQTFSTSDPLGAPTNFVSGVASFTSLNHTLPAGHSYLWLTYDVDPGATHENILDVMVTAGGISANGQTYPDTDQSPAGQRVIYEALYHEDFEGTHNWILSGEFQVDTPAGLGGDPGYPDPEEAYRGTRVLGTDLTGIGSNPYNYESDLTEATAYMATSPSVNALYYKNLNLFYSRHLNIEWLDNARIQVSTDDGITWNNLWENTQILDFQWTEEQLAISDIYSRSDQMKIRYILGPTTGFNNFSGWNIDDIYLTGEFISKDVGVSEWILPQSGSGHTDSDSVTVRIRNYGGAEIVDPVPVAYSLNGGATWTVNQMNENIPVDGSVVFTFSTRADLSQPGLRPSVLAKTTLPGDQYSGNDQISTELYIVPTYTPPYLEDFESGEGFWRDLGTSIWEHGTPVGTVISGASSGTKSWATGLSTKYGDLIVQENKTIFEDGFESDMGWVLTEEFERTSPDNIFIPYFAYSGYNCIGTDLSGLGTNQHQYENGITAGTAYTATSPAFDVTHYSDIRVSFWGWINIQNGDSIKLEVSPDNGSTWHTLWKNSEGEIMEFGYEPREYTVPDAYIFTDALKFRFSLFYSSAGGAVAEGWFIDDFMVTGDYVESEPGTLSSPSYDLTGMVNPMITADLWIDTELDVDGAVLQYSIDDGDTWISVANTSGYDAYWNWYTGNPVEALGEDGWSGQSGGWIPVKHLLPAALVNQDNVQFRFAFSADKSYNQFDGMAVDNVRIMEAQKDLDLIDILDPVSACELSEAQSFTLRLKNVGLSPLQTGDSLDIGYYIDMSGNIQSANETLILTQSWPVGTTRDISMSTSFDFGESGDYLTDVYVISSDPHFYSAVSNDTISRTIEVNKPYVELGDDISTVRPDTVTLRAYSGVPGQTYLWQDSSTDSIFQVSSDGKYYVRVTNGLGCIASDTVHVLQLIADVGVSTYLGPQSDCELADQLPLEVNIENMGTDTLEVGDTIFIGGIINLTDSFEDTRVLTERFKPGQSFDFTYSRLFDFSAPGDYQMKLYTRLAGDEVLANDTLYHMLENFGYPDAYLGPDTTVLAQEYILTPAAGYFEYYWQDESTGETFTVDQPGTGTYHVRVSDENQCTSYDTVIVTLNVHDLELDQLLSPATSCNLSESITVSARIRNAGNQAIPAGETINMGYRIDGGSIVQEGKVLQANLLPGTTMDFTFSNSETVQTGQWYDFSVFVDYTNDVKHSNDTVITSVGVFEPIALDLGEDFQVVTGFEHTLDAGPGFASYEWQDSSTNQTFTISEPGIFTIGVTVSDANGCTEYDEVVVMLAVPDIGILEISHPLTNCRLEESEHVQVAVKNFGNWDIEPSADIKVSYSINGAAAVTEDLVLEETFNNGAVIYHTFSREEDFSDTGRYEIVAYTEFSNDLIASNNIVLGNVDHFGSPLIDIGNGADTILLYDPITLTATPGYPAYVWQDGSTENIFEITDPSAGMYVVSVTAVNGCITTDSVYVAFDKPDLGIVSLWSPVSSCGLDQSTPVSMEIINNGFYRISTRDTITIAYSVNGAASVIENVQLDSELPPGQSRVLSFQTPYDFSQPGTYEVQLSMVYLADEDNSNNLLLSDVVVWGYPQVEIGNGQDIIISDLPLTLDAGTGFSSYQWQDLSTGSTFVVSQNGLYWVTVTNEFGCAASDSVYVDDGTAVNDLSISNGLVRIYPNPVKEKLHIAFELDVKSSVTLELYSVVNALVYRKDINKAMVTEAHIDVQGITPGTYILRVFTDDVPHNFVVIVE